MVDAAEVRYDDRNRKCYDQHAAERANSADDLADDRLRNHVTVAVAHAHCLDYTATLSCLVIILW